MEGGLAFCYNVDIYIYVNIVRIPALPKDIGNQHVRVKDMIHLKFVENPLAIIRLFYIIIGNTYKEIIFTTFQIPAPAVDKHPHCCSS